jgi:type III secretion protein W
MNLHETLQLTQFVGGKHLKHQLAFLNGLRPMLQQLPILLWRDLKARQTALGNLLTLMAELTRQEQNPTQGNTA